MSGLPLSTDDIPLVNHVHNLRAGLDELRPVVDNISRVGEGKFADLFATTTAFTELVNRSNAEDE